MRVKYIYSYIHRSANCCGVPGVSQACIFNFLCDMTTYESEKCFVYSLKIFVQNQEKLA